MIISDKYKLAFVHIPKCAGTSVRSQLSVLDDRDGVFESRVEVHRELGLLDYVHIPLKILQIHFPDEFKCIAEYRAFAVTRGIHERFASALAQYCNYQTDMPFKRHSSRSIVRQALAVIDILDNLSICGRCPDLLPAELIHFQPQRDYIFCDGKQIVKTLVPLKDLDGFIRGLMNEMLIEPSRVEKNPALAYRSSTVWAISNLANRLVPDPGQYIPPALYSRMRAVLYRTGGSATWAGYREPRIRDFVDRFYACDQAMLRSSTI
jgi:hypothetical protein